MSAATDSLLVDSDEDVPNPPKRARTRGRGRSNVTSRGRQRQIRARATRSTRRVQASQPVNVINVGDIDSDEAPETPKKMSAAVVDTPEVVEEPLISIDALAQALGVTECSPFKTGDISTNTVQTTSRAHVASTSISSSTPENPSPLEGTSSICGTSSTNSYADKDASNSSIGTNAQANKDTGDNASSSSAPAPKKSVRRGLAKRDAGLNAMALDSSSGLEVHNTAVYTQCVPSVRSMGLLPPQGQPDTNFPDFTSTSETQSEGENLSGSETTSSKMTVTNSSNHTTVRKDLAEISDEEVDNDKDDDDDIAEVKSTDTSLQLRSPTPPPLISGKMKGKRLNQKLSNALQTINNVKGRLEKLEKAAPKSRGGGGRSKDILIVGEEEGIVKKDMVVKVRFLSTVHRISMNLDKTLHFLTRQLSQQVGDIEEHSLSLFLGDEVVDLSSTPRSIGLSVADILDCHQIKASEELDTATSSQESLKLVVQCLHSRSKTTIDTHKRQPLRSVIEKYADMNGLNPDSLRLTFDGEDVDPRDSPGKLDMENLDVVDIIVSR